MPFFSRPPAPEGAGAALCVAQQITFSSFVFSCSKPGAAKTHKGKGVERTSTPGRLKTMPSVWKTKVDTLVIPNNVPNAKGALVFGHPVDVFLLAALTEAKYIGQVDAGNDSSWIVKDGLVLFFHRTYLLV